jgi:RNA polymerase sigma-70 factor, ECF subfamily
MCAEYGMLCYMTSEEYAEAYRRGFNLAVRFWVSRGVSYDDAVESVQAAWAKGWERRDQLRQPASLLPWIISIAGNIRKSVLRQQQREISGDESHAASQPADAASIDAKKVLNQSKPLHRAVLEAHYMQGFTALEIAEAEGVSEGAIRLRLLRARRNLKKKVDRRLP